MQDRTDGRQDEYQQMQDRTDGGQDEYWTRDMQDTGRCKLIYSVESLIPDVGCEMAGDFPHEK